MNQLLLEIKATRIKKIDLLRRMLKATLQQNEALENDDTDKLTEALEKRQRLAAMIDELDASYADLTGLYTVKTGQKLTEEAWPGMGACLAEIKEILLKIKVLDQKNMVLCEQKLEQYKNELKDARQSGHRVSSYVTPFLKAEEGTYFDSKK